jgi:HlyD family secretion protein
MMGEDDLWIKLFVPETVLGRLRIGQPVKVFADCFQDQCFDGHISSIASSAEFTPRNVQSLEGRRHQRFAVKVRLADSMGIFKSGMAAEVLVPTDGNPIKPVVPPAHTECRP